MILSLQQSELKNYIARQLDYFFPDQKKMEGPDVDLAFSLALDKAEYCFSKVSVKGYNQNGQVAFSHLHSDQYSQFLYWFSNSLWNESQNKLICDKLILLNRALFGLWYSYKVILPEIFLFIHPVGSVIGHAVYQNYLVINQGVTIGERQEIEEPIGKGLFCSAGSKIIGGGKIGDRVSLGVDAVVFRESIPDDTVVYIDKDTQQRKMMTREKNKNCTAQSFFSVEI